MDKYIHNMKGETEWFVNEASQKEEAENFN